MNELAPYIERYYPAWFSYARYISTCLGIRNEADDILCDAMEMLCRKDEETINDLLRHELSGDQKLRNLVFRMIQKHTYRTLRDKPKLAPIEYITYHYTQTEESDQQFTDEMRDVTARLREDDFISPRTMRKMGPIIGSVSQIIAHGNVAYRAVIKRGKERPLAKQCTTRHAAFEWLVQMSNQRVNG